MMSRDTYEFEMDAQYRTNYEIFTERGSREVVGIISRMLQLERACLTFEN